jgi:hypothetical protein
MQENLTFWGKFYVKTSVGWIFKFKNGYWYFIVYICDCKVEMLLMQLWVVDYDFEWLLPLLVEAYNISLMLNAIDEPSVQRS